MILPSSQHPVSQVDSAVEGAQQQLFGALRRAREEVAVIRTAVATQNGIDPIATAFNENSALVEENLRQAADLAGRYPALDDRWSDHVARVRNLWNAVQNSWTATRGGRVTADLFAAVIDRMVRQIEVITVPSRLTEELRELSVGDVLLVHTAFADEMPDAAMRIDVLSDVQTRFRSLPGVIDLAAGTVIRAADSVWWRRASSLMLACVMAAVVAIASVTSRWIDAVGLPSPASVTDRQYAGAVVAAYAGAVAHLLVAAMKQQRGAAAAPGRTFVAIGNWVMWIHVHQTYLLLNVLAIPVVAYVSVIGAGTSGPGTLFLLGYSIDSVLDVLLTKFETATKKQSDLVAQVLAQVSGSR
jgi:hypothetical protein